MKTYIKLIAVLIIGVLNLAFNISFAQVNIKLFDNYDSLYNAVKSGVPASIYKTSYMNEFSLVEKSLITVYPETNGEYKVDITVQSLTKGNNSDSYDRNSVLGFITSGCKTFGSKYNKFNNTSCSFYAVSPEDAMEAAKNGISQLIEDKYIIEGTLVDVYKKICVTDKPEPTPVKKPAVYLYPVESMDISVQLKVNGSLTFTDPDYNTGWNVNVSPEGTINNKNDYLFYEADLNKIELPDEGWVVEYGNLKTWFDEYLPKLGLNSKEKEQFEDYWLSKLRKAKYYDIRLLSDKFLSENMDLLIKPKPETILRLNFYFKPLSSKIELNVPEIKEVIRNRFTVIEWGGINGGDLKIIP